MDILNWSLPSGWNIIFLKALVAFFVPVFFGLLLARFLKKIGKNNGVGKLRVYQFFSSSTRIVSVIFGLISALATIGIDVSVLIAGLGLTGLGLSLALKDTISNLVAGLMMMIYDSFNLDSTIKVGDTQGKVTEMNLRYVHIKTETDTTLIPNSTFLNTAVKVMDELDEEKNKL